MQPFEGQSDFDHRPVALRLCFQRAARRSKTQPRWDRKAMLTPQGKARLRAIYDALPVFPWQLDVDTHLSKINAYLRSQLSRFFPAQPHQPRSPVIQPDTWQLVQDRRDLRRELHAMHRCAAASIATTTCPVQPVPLEATADLCLVTLAQGYGQLKPNKAAGVTGLPAEAYSGDALGAALAHLWRRRAASPFRVQRGAAPGLRARRASLPPSKTRQTPAESFGLAEHSAARGFYEGSVCGLRPPLLKCLEASRAPGQCGGRPRNPLQISHGLGQRFCTCG